MPTIDLIHLGDIHYPEHWATVDVDMKDTAPPGNVVDAVVRPQTLVEVISHALEIRDKHDGSVVVVSGDLTTRAEMDPYGYCAGWLAQTFDLPATADRFHVVPGNHDVVRALANDAESPLNKFAPAQDAWAAVATADVLAVDAPRRTVVTNGQASLAVISLNSCIGSGEHRHLPTSVRGQLAAIIKEFDEHAAAGADPLGTVYEQLDTPAFTEVDVKAALAAIDAGGSALPVVVAHHNLLPQATERFEIYTELINGGSVRSRLAGLARPVVYLHGHTHTSPIEVVVQEAPLRGRLVSIGAPLLVEGFNHIRVEFEPVHGRPLGLTVTAHRILPGGGFSTQETRVPLSVTLGPPSPSARDLEVALGDAHRYFDDLAAELDKNGHSRDVVEQAARELEWRGSIVIDNRCDETAAWQLRRPLP